MAVISLKNKLKSGSLLVGNEYYNPTEFESIATVTVGSGGQSTVTFSSIPSTYKHLQIRFMADLDTVDRIIRMRINGVTTTGTYSKHGLEGNGSSASAYGVDSAATSLDVGYIPNTNSHPAVAVIDILDYANTNKYKVTRSLCGNDQNGSGLVGLYSGNYMNTSAITSIEFSLSGTGNFSQYSHFALYGIGG